MMTADRCQSSRPVERSNPRPQRRECGDGDNHQHERQQLRPDLRPDGREPGFDARSIGAAQHGQIDRPLRRGDRVQHDDRHHVQREGAGADEHDEHRVRRQREQADRRRHGSGPARRDRPERQHHAPQKRRQEAGRANREHDWQPVQPQRDPFASDRARRLESPRQHVAKSAGTRRPRRRILGKRRHHERRGIAGDARVEAGERRRRGVHVRVEHIADRARERLAAAQHAIRDHPEAVDIGARGHRGA